MQHHIKNSMEKRVGPSFIEKATIPENKNLKTIKTNDDNSREMHKGHSEPDEKNER